MWTRMTENKRFLLVDLWCANYKLSITQVWTGPSKAELLFWLWISRLGEERPRKHIQGAFFFLQSHIRWVSSASVILRERAMLNYVHGRLLVIFQWGKTYSIYCIRRNQFLENLFMKSFCKGAHHCINKSISIYYLCSLPVICVECRWGLG